MIEWMERKFNDPYCNSCNADEDGMYRLMINNGNSGTTVIVLCKKCAAMLIDSSPISGITNRPIDVKDVSSVETPHAYG